MSRAAFGIPLVPADEHADLAVARVEGVKAEVAGGEVVLLEIERIVGDVHLAVEPATLPSASKTTAVLW